MLLLSHPTGNANVRHAALGLARAGLLAEFWTCLGVDPSAAWLRLLPAGLAAQFRRRAVPEELRTLTHSRAWREIVRLAAGRAGTLTRHETGRFCVDAIYRDLDRATARRLGRGAFTGVYAYEDGAAATFAAARARGLATFYDQPIGYWRAARRILTEEAALQPAWAATIVGNRDSAAKTERKDDELRHADVVFAATSFTKATLQEHPGFTAPVHVLPYGAPASESTSPRSPYATAGLPLRVLYVGSLGQRKGLSYLFAAAAQAGRSITLTVVGTKPAEPCEVLERALGAHHWIASLPHADVLERMRHSDVLVFPSLFEGFGLVILEAMAQGLPVITTPHTAGPDLITDGVDGFIVPIRDASAIAARLDRLYRDRDLLGAMGEAARARAAQFTWTNYEQQLAERVRARLAPAPSRAITHTTANA
ncbi:MAG: glycosyltransferase family 4 protein [Opitutaceae bacterium]|nr:glycosyltransferase family 4 protein [Opitutaceae bacterium]